MDALTTDENGLLRSERDVAQRSQEALVVDYDDLQAEKKDLLDKKDALMVRSRSRLSWISA